MRKILLIGLWLSIVVLAAAFGDSARTLTSQSDCGDSYTKHQLAPERPARLVAFRENPQDGRDLGRGIRLHWINLADDANCTFVEIKYAP